MNFFSNPINLVISLVILVFSAILHEIAHGYVAERLGDPTARLMGRLTLDPRKHIDPFMTVLLPLITWVSTGGRHIFGGAKPVPVDVFNLRDGRKDLALVSLAGPMTNFIIAILGSLIFHAFRLDAHSIGASISLPSICFEIIAINIFLGVFNLLPIPPLDGSKVFSLILPESQARSYLSIGGVFGLFLVFFALQLSFIQDILNNIINALLTLLGF